MSFLGTPIVAMKIRYRDISPSKSFSMIATGEVLYQS
jgi:hypothetical protein